VHAGAVFGWPPVAAWFIEAKRESAPAIMDAFEGA